MSSQFTSLRRKVRAALNRTSSREQQALSADVEVTMGDSVIDLADDTTRTFYTLRLHGQTAHVEIRQDFQENRTYWKLTDHNTVTRCIAYATYQHSLNAAIDRVREMGQELP